VHGDLTSGSVFERIGAHVAHPMTIIDAFRGAPIGKPLLWIGIIAGLFFAQRTQRFLLTAAAIQLACYFVAYLATPHDVQWHVRWSWERLVSHVTPLLAYAVLVAVFVPSEVEAPSNRAANDCATGR
jgi:hypothetical protein